MKPETKDDGLAHMIKAGWEYGLSTYAISVRLKVSEALVYNTLYEIRKDLHHG